MALSNSVVEQASPPQRLTHPKDINKEKRVVKIDSPKDIKKREQIPGQKRTTQAMLEIGSFTQESNNA